MTNQIINSDLFNQALINPAKDKVSDLYIVSGYASSAMVSRHAEQLSNQEINLNIHLIIGMACRDGISKTNHLGFKRLMDKELSGKFTCSYLVKRDPVHSKVYTWAEYKNKPVKSFLGSANYSQQAFIGKSQGEVLVNCDPHTAFDYYSSLINDSIYCNHSDIEDLIIFHSNERSYINQEIEESNIGTVATSFSGLEKVTVSLISSKTNDVTTRSGLNWGQRPEYKRNPNQAYIQLSPAIYRSSFFPLRSIHFTISTDDGKSLLCTRAQKDEKGHAIETPRDNSRLGEYFRYRLGVSNGELITKQHLLDYGRTTVGFYKIDEENYFMDFSSTKS